MARPGQANCRQAWPCQAWPGQAWPGLARPGQAWPGLARHGWPSFPGLQRGNGPPFSPSTNEMRMCHVHYKAIVFARAMAQWRDGLITMLGGPWPMEQGSWPRGAEPRQGGRTPRPQAGRPPMAVSHEPGAMNHHACIKHQASNTKL